jgi:hypothetical protein
MLKRTRSFTWHGEAFRFQYMPSGQQQDRPGWAVMRRGEFIGIMPGVAEVTTKEFEVRAARWVSDLLRGSNVPRRRR